MRITEKKLIDAGCCQEGVDRYFSGVGRKSYDSKKLLGLAIKLGRYRDARTVISKLMTAEQCIEWSIYCAESVLHIFEDAYPDDKRPCESIEAAKQYLADPSDINKDAVVSAAACYDGNAAAAAYVAVVYAAYTAAYDAGYAATAAYDAAANSSDILLYKGLEIIES
jgi:hypothetical protein